MADYYILIDDLLRDVRAEAAPLALATRLLHSRSFQMRAPEAAPENAVTAVARRDIFIYDDKQNAEPQR